MELDALPISCILVKMRDGQYVLTKCGSHDPALAESLKLATKATMALYIELPETEEAKTAVAGIEHEKRENVSPSHSDLVAMIPGLSYRIEELELSKKTLRALIEDLGMVYVWEVVEQGRVKLLETKGLGRKSINEVTEILFEIDVTLQDRGVNLNIIREFLPQVS